MLCNGREPKIARVIYDPNTCSAQLRRVLHGHTVWGGENNEISINTDSVGNSLIHSKVTKSTKMWEKVLIGCPVSLSRVKM